MNRDIGEPELFDAGFIAYTEIDACDATQICSEAPDKKIV
jgi:hypothetical protein